MEPLNNGHIRWIITGRLSSFRGIVTELVHQKLSVSFSKSVHYWRFHCTRRVPTSMVFPLPGGPNSMRPRAGALSPVNNYQCRYIHRERNRHTLYMSLSWGQVHAPTSGLMVGRITISCSVCFGSSSPTAQRRPHTCTIT